MSELIDKLFAVHDSLTAACLAHAFGGAIALAYCTEEPRGTRDLDVNIFSAAADARTVLAGFPAEITVTATDIAVVKRHGQTRLWWDETPIDVFLNHHPLHDAVAAGIVWVPLIDRKIPVLDGASLVVFKALFDRTRDWADIEAVADASPGHVEEAAATIAELMGEDDPAYRRLGSLGSSSPPYR